jgi:hypothetical protein
MSSSSNYSEDEVPVKQGPKKRVRRVPDQINPLPNESSHKGFVTAFTTIMNRDTTETLAAPAPDRDQPAPAQPERKGEKRVVPAHEKSPAVEKDDVLSGIARKGIVKLFRAVAINRKKAAAANQGKLRRLSRTAFIRNQKSGKEVKTPSGQSMSSFIEMLKNSKKA